MNRAESVFAGVLCAAVMVASVSSAQASVVDSLFKPDRFASLGTLNATIGTINWSISVDNGLLLMAVPEPGTWLLLLSALVCGLLLRRRWSDI